jgi:hypothetical protein
MTNVFLESQHNLSFIHLVIVVNDHGKLATRFDYYNLMYNYTSQVTIDNVAFFFAQLTNYPDVAFFHACPINLLMSKISELTT